MKMFGYPLETIYLFTLIASGSLTLIYIVLSDVLDGVFDFFDHPILSPQLFLSFITVFSAVGYLFEKYTEFSSLLIGLASGGIGLIVVLLLHFFVFVPLKSAETSLNYSEADLEGRVAKVIVTLPKDGFGEIMIQNKSGVISKPAQSVKNEEIPAGAEVVIVEMKNGVAKVSTYDPYNLEFNYKGELK
jgi:membrane protein implicated in regulation of membrane protease activity